MHSVLMKPRGKEGEKPKKQPLSKSRTRSDLSHDLNQYKQDESSKLDLDDYPKKRDS